MGSLSVWHWLIFLVIALLAFGGSGKISSIMGDVAKGIKSFKQGMKDDEEELKATEAQKSIDAKAAKPAEPTKQGEKSISV
jgi:sec-independent protein translocase protein TatA